jgi:hypothetical protein
VSLRVRVEPVLTVGLFLPDGQPVRLPDGSAALVVKA